MSGQGTVLVTGGSGFIGSWCVIGLLQQGYTVRTTVRNLARESAVRAAIGKVVEAQDRLSFHAANLTSDAGWGAVAAGCDYMLHVASPVVIEEPKNADDLIIPARDGTRRAIGAALDAGVKRVVLTSSVAATTPRGGARESLSDETVWTDLDDPEVSAYSRSKTLAERAAWDLVGASGGATDTRHRQSFRRARSGPQPGLFRLGPARGAAVDRQGARPAAAGLQHRRRARRGRPAYCRDDRAARGGRALHRGRRLRLDRRSRGLAARPTWRRRRQGADAQGPRPDPAIRRAVRQEPGGRDAASRATARVQLGEGADHAWLAAAAAGGNGRGLCQEPDRDWRELKGDLLCIAGFGANNAAHSCCRTVVHTSP